MKLHETQTGRRRRSLTQGRLSQYRLAAHLRTTLAHYTGMFAAALSLMAAHAAIVTGLVFLTALSGALLSGSTRVRARGAFSSRIRQRCGSVRPPRARDDDVSHALPFASTWRVAVRVVRATAAAFAMANVQAALGISALLYLVRYRWRQFTKPCGAALGGDA
ncbi:hypothetical protein EDB89DRAFT_2073111 [Lactarius sanguifluus]|nr:hypothetical protein EDB89DRAFT_2073111 [Lactarius sanguifluus]